MGWEKEMRMLIESLFTCEQFNMSPGGHPTFIEFKQDYLEKLFDKNNR